jgi:hypothetical protein
MNENEAPKIENKPATLDDILPVVKSQSLTTTKKIQEALDNSGIGRIHKILEQSGFGKIQKVMEQSGVGQFQKLMEQSGVGQFQKLMEQSGVGQFQKLMEQSGVRQFQKLIEQIGVGQIQRPLLESFNLRHIHNLAAVSSLSRLMMSEGTLALTGLPTSAVSSRLVAWLTDDPERLDQAVQLVDVEGIDSLEFATAEVDHVIPDQIQEQAIIDALEQEKPIGLWSDSARAALTKTVSLILFLIRCFVAVVALGQAIEWLAGKVETVSTAAEVRRIAAALPEPFRWMLTTYRLVTRQGVRVRQSHTVHSVIVGHLAIGQLIEVLDEQDGWLQIQADVSGESIVGWIYKGYTVPFPPSKGE